MAKAKKAAPAKKTAAASSSKVKKATPVKAGVKPAAAKKEEGFTHLKPGMKAPVFKGLDQHGKKRSLSEFKGKKLAIYFYPHDMTPTCTVQACNLRDNFALLKKHDIEIIGISVDDEKSHLKFMGKHALPFTLIADPETEILRQYGVWGEKMFMGRKITGTHRTTFLIDEKGVIVHVIHKPKSKEHAEEIIAVWNALQ